MTVRRIVGGVAIFGWLCTTGLPAGDVSAQAPAGQAPATQPAAAPLVVPKGPVRSDIADAAARGDRAAVQKLIAAKTDVNAPQVDGATALHWAVYRDDLQLADMIIRAGANVKAANRAGMTPLMMAAIYGNVPMLDRLIKAGADPKERGPNGETMVM